MRRMRRVLYASVVDVESPVSDFDLSFEHEIRYGSVLVCNCLLVVASVVRL